MKLPDHPLFDKKNWTFQNVLEVIIGFALNIAGAFAALFALWVFSVLMCTGGMFTIASNTNDALMMGIAWGSTLGLLLSLVGASGLALLAQSIREQRST